MSEPLAFVSVREIYPNVGNEAYAFQAWMEALRQDDAMKILEGTKRWVAWWTDEGTSPAFIPPLDRFLRNRKYRIDPVSKPKKAWLGSPQAPTRRWTAGEANEPKISHPIQPAPPEPSKAPRRGFRSAKEILAQHNRG